MDEHKAVAGAAITIDTHLANALLPARPENGHKGVFGHLFIVAGSRGFTGAAIMAAQAAGRSGVGLVTLGVPASLGDCVAAQLLEAMTRLLPCTESEALAREALFPAIEFSVDKQAVVLGPGLSQGSETRDFVLDFIRQCPVPLVIDADGLNALSTNLQVLREAASPCILTPHPGEMARLTGIATAEIQSDREGIARDFAHEWQCTVVLKGARTVIAHPEGMVHVNPTGNAGLAKGGTGDVLAGLMGGLLAQGMEPYDAAVLAVYAHGLAADVAVRRMTQWAMTPTDVIAALPDAWWMIERGA